MQYHRMSLGDRIEKQVAHRVCQLLDADKSLTSRAALALARKQLKQEYAARENKKKQAKKAERRAARHAEPLTSDTENYVLTRSKHRGKRLGVLADAELEGLIGAYNRMKQFARLTATFKAEILRRRNALDTEYREIVATVQYTATDLRPPLTHAELLRIAKRNPPPREFYDAPQEEPPFDIDDTATGID